MQETKPPCSGPQPGSPQRLAEQEHLASVLTAQETDLRETVAPGPRAAADVSSHTAAAPGPRATADVSPHTAAAPGPGPAAAPSALTELSPARPSATPPCTARPPEGPAGHRYPPPTAWRTGPRARDGSLSPAALHRRLSNTVHRWQAFVADARELLVCLSQAADQAASAGLLAPPPPLVPATAGARPLPTVPHHSPSHRGYAEAAPQPPDRTPPRCSPDKRARDSDYEAYPYKYRRMQDQDGVLLDRLVHDRDTRRRREYRACLQAWNSALCISSRARELDTLLAVLDRVRELCPGTEYVDSAAGGEDPRDPRDAGNKTRVVASILREVRARLGLDSKTTRNEVVAQALKFHLAEQQAGLDRAAAPAR